MSSVWTSCQKDESNESLHKVPVGKAQAVRVVNHVTWHSANKLYHTVLQHGGHRYDIGCPVFTFWLWLNGISIYGCKNKRTSYYRTHPLTPTTNTLSWNWSSAEVLLRSAQLVAISFHFRPRITHLYMYSIRTPVSDDSRERIWREGEREREGGREGERESLHSY